MARFFKFSAKRQCLLDRALDIVTPLTHAKKLKDTCHTHWIQRIDSYTPLKTSVFEHISQKTVTHFAITAPPI